MRLPLANPSGESVNVRSHAMISFGISSRESGPLAWTLCVHDNGQGSGSENTQSSQVVAITRYLPLVDQQVREVSIPIGELLEGSTCSPVLIDITISASEAVAPRHQPAADPSARLERAEPGRPAGGAATGLGTWPSG